MSTSGLPIASANGKGLTAGGAAVCTSEPAADCAGRLRELAEAIRGLTPNERETLRQLLVD